MAEPAADSLLTAVLDRLFTGEGAFAASDSVVSGLTGEQAVAAVEGLPNSIIVQVGHMVYWMRLYLGWIEAGRATDPPDREVEWRAAGPGDWPALHITFLELVGRCRELAQTAVGTVEVEGDVVPVSSLLGDLGAHNAYHLGQITLMRRLQGSWPPS